MDTTISKTNPIAYFCAEYGVATELPLYAGGLGVLAGDTIKEAADQALPFIGIGLLYRGHGVVQQLTEDGLQIESDYLFDPLSNGLEHVYLNDEPLFIKVHLTEIDVWLRVWKKSFDNGVILYLLDSETDQNELNERDITHVLYSGTRETLLKQQLLLGIGGVKLLAKLGISPAVYHINEGRPAFAHWQLIRMFMDDNGLSYSEAKQLARSRTVYTNHTLVAAGNQEYSPNLLKVYGEYYAQKMGISIDTLIADGINPATQQFSITLFALASARKANGVSQLHTKLSQETWPEFSWVNVTNGVHLPTWQAPSFTRHHELTDSQLWYSHLDLKRLTREFIQQQTGYGYDETALVLCWARRLAGYKQLPLLFADLQRLRSLLQNKQQPIQLLVAGKAHSGDTAGKQMLQSIISYFTHELNGSALFIPNYTIQIAQMLTRGVDVWLNTPEFGKEACGTSGMKAASNGVLNCTVADGWAAEVSWNTTGWILDHTNLSESFYTTLESNIAPLYYARTTENIPQTWVAHMRSSIDLSTRFSATRMLEEYQTLLYSK